jgi:DNA polymerase III subunit epsilon
MRLEEMSLVAVDLETTGLDFKRDEIVAFAAVPIRNMRIMAGDAYYTTICPDRYKLESMKYHGISAGNLKQSPCFADQADRLLGALDGMLVGYCVEVDYRFLQRFFRKERIPFNRQLVDIASIEKGIVRTHGGRAIYEAFSFDALLKCYGLREYYRHNALADAFFSAQIFQFQCMKYNINTLEELTDIMRLDTTRECGFML